MQTVKLSNGVIMPLEGFGVFQITDGEVCRRTVQTALGAGYRLIDTASSYQNKQAVGAAIRAAGVPREELYQTGKVRAIGVCNFDAARLMDLCWNADIRPMVNQIERHPHFQREEELRIMAELGVQPQAWAPFAEGMHGMFTDPVLTSIAHKHGKSVAQVILRWDIQRGVAVIPKSVHRERLEENLDVWDFMLDMDDLVQIAALDRGQPSMLDPHRPSEVRRVYDYLRNPVLTSL